jgi:hypothetical protein
MKYLRYNLHQICLGNPPAYVTYLGSAKLWPFRGRRGNAEKSPLDRFRNATNKRLLHPFMYNSFDSQNQPLTMYCELESRAPIKEGPLSFV